MPRSSPGPRETGASGSLGRVWTLWESWDESTVRKAGVDWEWRKSYDLTVRKAVGRRCEG